MVSIKPGSVKSISAIDIIHWPPYICEKASLYLTGRATFFHKHLTTKRQRRLLENSSRIQAPRTEGRGKETNSGLILCKSSGKAKLPTVGICLKTDLSKPSDIDNNYNNNYNNNYDSNYYSNYYSTYQKKIFLKVRESSPAHA